LSRFLVHIISRCDTFFSAQGSVHYLWFIRQRLSPSVRSIFATVHDSSIFLIYFGLQWDKIRTPKFRSIFNRFSLPSTNGYIIIAMTCAVLTSDVECGEARLDDPPHATSCPTKRATRFPRITHWAALKGRAHINPILFAGN